MANGRVKTGFSSPYIGIYSYDSVQGKAKYNNVQILARGVSVSAEADKPSPVDFYADNKLAERVSGAIQSGTITLTVDGLLPTAEALLFGLPTPDTDGVYHYGDDATIPYVGVGFIARYISDGVESFQGVVFTKCKFDIPNENASTSEDSVSFQTQELTGSWVCCDNSNHDWKMVTKSCTSETDAVTELLKILA